MKNNSYDEMPKWMKEFYKKEGTDEATNILERINNLLRRAMHGTDDESLHEEIANEINRES